MCSTRNLTELLQEADFKQPVREPTHVGGHILDLVITQNSHNIISSAFVETLLTDHHVIRCDLVTAKPKRPRRQIRYRKYTTIDHTKPVYHLRNPDLFNNPNDRVDELSTHTSLPLLGWLTHMHHLSLVLPSSDPRHRGTTGTFTRVCKTSTENS